MRIMGHLTKKSVVLLSSTVVIILAVVAAVGLSGGAKSYSTISISTTATGNEPVSLSTLDGHNLELSLHQVVVLPGLGKNEVYTMTSNPAGVVTYASGRYKSASATKTTPILVATTTGKSTVTLVSPNQTVTFTVAVAKRTTPKK